MIFNKIFYCNLLFLWTKFCLNYEKHNNFTSFSIEEKMEFPNIFLSENETIIKNLEDYFSGFNLTYNLTSKNEKIQKEFVKLNEKFQLINKTEKAFFFPENVFKIIFFNINKTSEKIALIDKQNNLFFGKIENNLPFFVNKSIKIVENNKSKIWKCFDLIYLNFEEILIDCSAIFEKEKNTTFIEDNFFIVNQTSMEIILKKNNSIIKSNNTFGNNSRNLKKFIIKENVFIARLFLSKIINFLYFFKKKLINLL